MAEAVYTIVRDQGGNPGLLCPVCGQARWTSNHKTIDWSTQSDCPNCTLMLENQDAEKELQKHKLFIQAEKEKEKAKADIDAADTQKKKDREKAKAFKKASRELAKEQGIDDELSELEQ